MRGRPEKADPGYEAARGSLSRPSPFRYLSASNNIRMPYSVITHSGKAHIDEIMAIAVLAVFKGENPSAVHRLSAEELMPLLESGESPPDTWVIDCGLIHDPDRRLFDHHQDRELPSAALLMLRHYFPELLDTDLGKNFALISKADTQGLRSLEDVNGTEDGADAGDSGGESRDYWSFIARLLIKTFEEKPLTVIETAAHGLAETITFEDVKRCAREWIAVEGRLVPVQVAGLSVLEYRVPPPEELVNGLKAIDGELIETHQAAAVYGFDKSDPDIRTLYRTDIGHNRLDFTRAEFTRPLFCHQGGFLARFKPSDGTEWKRVLEHSLT